MLQNKVGKLHVGHLVLLVPDLQIRSQPGRQQMLANGPPVGLGPLEEGSAGAETPTATAAYAATALPFATGTVVTFVVAALVRSRHLVKEAQIIPAPCTSSTTTASQSARSR